MQFEDLVRFSRDLRENAGIENSVRRKGDQIAIKIARAEFFFDQGGRYSGCGSVHHSALADLVEDLDPHRPEP